MLCFRYRLLPLLLLGVSAGNHLTAEVTLDGTLGPAGTLSGPDYQVTADLGQQVGSNLFHSFGRFGLDTGESATFSGPDSVANVIGRVTGGEASNIDGTIRSTIPAADLYLTNPAGIVFGPNARLDVDGSFHASTAHHLSLEDGGRFDAAAPQSSTLTAAPVAAFGFLDQTPAQIGVDGARLQVPEGEQLTLVGGDVRIADATLYAPGGRIEVAAAGAGGEVVMEQGALELGDTDSGGEVEIVHTAESRPEASGNELGNLDVSGESGGSIHIRGGRIIVQGGWVMADTWGEGDAAGVDLQAQGKILLQDGALLSSYTLGAGNAGLVRVSADENMEIVNGSVIASGTSAAGDGGTITVEAGGLQVDGQGSQWVNGIMSLAYTGSSGNAGAVDVAVKEALEVVDGGEISISTYAAGDSGTLTVEAGQLLVDGRGSEYVTGIASQANSGSSGVAGAVDIRVAGTMEVVDGGQISSGTIGQGNAGTVTVQAGQLRVDGARNSAWATGVFSNADSGSSGNAGAVDIGVDGVMEVVSGGQISSDTYAQGDAGRVTVAADQLLVEGQGSESFTGVFSEANPGSSGDAGGVDIRVEGAVEVIDGGRIGSNTYADGDAGTVTMQAGQLRVDGQGSGFFTGIASQAADPGSSANAGAVDITVEESIDVVGGGEISCGTNGAGDAGTITVAAGRLLVDGQGYDAFTGITTEAHTGSSGNAGTVNINVSEIMEVLNGGQISSVTFARGDAGTVTVVAGRLLVDGQGSELATGIASQADSGSSGNGGAVDITVEEAMEVVDGGQISSTTFAEGDAGRVSVAAGRLLVDGRGSENTTGIASQADSGSSGAGGTVDITVEEILDIVDGGVISSGTFGKGHAGTVTVTAGRLRVDGQGSESTTGISSQANSGSGNAGAVDIVVEGTLEVVDGGQIGSSTFAQGDAGTVTVKADQLLAQGEDATGSSGIFSTTWGAGRGGRIEISASTMYLGGNGMIATTSMGTGLAGDIALMSDGSVQLDGGDILAESLQSSGGNITLAAPSTQVTAGGAITASVFGAESSDGGNVTVSGDNLVVLEGSRITATAVVGLGGRILVDTDVFLHDAESAGDVLDASSGTAGNDGTVEVNAPELDISGSLVALPGSFLDVSGTLGSSCDAARAGRRSSLLLQVREGVPVGPDGPAPRTNRGRSDHNVH